jgi:PAP2 superfamily
MAKQKNNAVLRWNALLIQAVKATNMKPPIVARAIAMVHTAMYDAWAHYDKKAMSVYILTLKKADSTTHSLENRQKALSFAAFRVLLDLFPKKGQPLEQQTLFTALMVEYGYDYTNESKYDAATPVLELTPERIGNTAAAELLEARHQDGSNQIMKYADTTEYAPVNNGIDPIVDINHWQPLITDKNTVPPTVQTFLVPHWCLVKPFAIVAADLRPPIPASYPQTMPITQNECVDVEPQQEATEFEKNCLAVLEFSKNLDDETKMIAEYWAAGANTPTPPGLWCGIAQSVSLRDGNDLSKDVKLFFALGNALMDSSIACWYSKRYYDFCRPISAIRTLYKNKDSERIWHTPYQAKGIIKLGSWSSYLPTPPFAEYTSGHSTFSAAAAEILTCITGSTYLGMTVTLPAGSSIIEPGLTPACTITLQWKFFAEAAEQAGLSRLIGGIHFPASNTEGLKMGKKIASLVFAKAKSYWEGTANSDNC